jgi:hypothetical protein
MKAVVITLALVFATAVSGQNTAGSDQGAFAGNRQAATGPVQTLRGCLSHTANTYVLLGLGSTPLMQYRITGGNTGALKGKLGHTLEVTGSVGNQESGASPNGIYDMGSTTGVGYATLDAQSVKNVYANCS